MRSRSWQAHLPIDDVNMQRGQCSAAARPSMTMSGFDEKACAVRSADQHATIDQEFSRRPIQPASGMRAFIVIRKNLRTLTQQDQAESTRTGFHVDANRTTVGDGIEPT